jgi:hypothetical protein
VHLPSRISCYSTSALFKRMELLSEQWRVSHVLTVQYMTLHDMTLHSHSHSLTQSLTHTVTHSHSHSLTQSVTHSLTYSHTPLYHSTTPLLHSITSLTSSLPPSLPPSLTYLERDVVAQLIGDIAVRHHLHLGTEEHFSINC